MPAPEQNVDFEPCPAGTHIGLCCRVIDLGTQETTYQGQVKHQRKVYIEWQLPDEQTEGGRPFAVGQRYTLSSSPKATLRQHLEAWRGKRFEDHEIAGFDLRTLLGKPCLINVVHQTRDGRTYADVASLSPLPKGTQAPALADAPVYLSLEGPNEYEPAVFAELSERLRETIARSPEHQRVTHPHPSQPEDQPAGHSDDEIPF